MNKYTYIEFITNSNSFVQCANELTINYLENLYKINKQEQDNFNSRHVLAAFEIDFIRDKYTYIIPKTIEHKTGFTDELLEKAIKLAKKHELFILLEQEYKNYIKGNEHKQLYYSLQEKEALRQLENKDYLSPILEKIAEKKGIKSTELVTKILEKVSNHYNIILNKEFLNSEISSDIDNMSLEQLLTFDVYDEIKSRFYLNNFSENIDTTEEEINTKNKKKK